MIYFYNKILEVWERRNQHDCAQCANAGDKSIDALAIQEASSLFETQIIGAQSVIEYIYRCRQGQNGHGCALFASIAQIICSPDHHYGFPHVTVPHNTFGPLYPHNLSLSA